MTMPEESGKKTQDTDQLLPNEKDESERGPDTRREIEAELEDAMEQTGTERDDFEES